MTTQPSQETVKPEPTQEERDLATQFVTARRCDHPDKTSEEIALSLIMPYRQRIEAAATQKLEAEKAELQEQLDAQMLVRHLESVGRESLQNELTALRAQLEKNHETLGFSSPATQSDLQREIFKLRSQLDGMTKALREIKTEKEIVACMDHLVKIRSARDAIGDGRFGIGAHNDHEAVEWRKLKVSLDELLARREAALTTQPQPVAGQKEGERTEWNKLVEQAGGDLVEDDGVDFDGGTSS